MNNKDTLEQNVEALLDNSGDAPRMDASAKARMRAQLIARHATKRSPLWAVGFGVAAAAAAALVLVRGGDDKPTEPQQAKLADGTTWVVEPGAKVTVLGPRHVRVEGAALLDVAPGKGTFVVDTARGKVEVLGTKFLVDGEPERTTAAVVRGSVKLASSDGDVTLHAGEQGVVEPGHPPTRGPAPRLSHLASWAAEQRHRDEHAQVVHHGTLFAKDPGIRSHPPWGDEYPLPMAALGVDVVVEDRVARIALDQTFHNELPQTLEGTYRFAIPADAALQRLAMYVDGKLMESGVVERMQARRIYEELVYRRVDPALLEWAGTGRLNLRIYPIPANQDKRLMLAYTQSLPKLYEDWTLTVPFPEVDRPVGALDFKVRIKACAQCQVSSTSHQIAAKPDGDDLVVTYHGNDIALGDSLVLRVRDGRTAPTVARDGEYLMVRAPAELHGAAEPYHKRSWVILDDVSASRDRTARKAQADLVDAFLRELDEEDRVGVVAFDVAARTLLPMTRVMDADRRAVAKKLADEGDVGATDLATGLDAALALLGGDPDANIIYLGDGVITAGATHLDELRAKLVGHARFIGVGVGDGPDTQTLDALAGATGGYSTDLDLADDLGWRAFDLVAALHTQRVTNVSATLEGGDGTVYVRAPQVADGEELELVASGAAKATRAVFTGTLAGQPWTKTVELPGPDIAHAGGYLPRLWAQRHIAARLLAKHDAIDPDKREARDEAIRREVVELGKKYFLLSRHTSLIVLENDAMYAQYGVAKGSGQMWAPYSMPATIDVKHPTVLAVDNGQPLERAPLQLFYDYDQYTYRTNLDVTVGTRASLGLVEKSTNKDSDKSAPDAPPAPPAEETKSVVAAQDALVEGHMGKAERQQQIAASGVLALRDESGGGLKADSWGTLGRGSGNGYGIGGGRGRFRGIAAGPTYPQRLNYPGDPAFGDLTAWVPALATDDATMWQHALGAPAMHVVEPAARDLLDAARAAVPTGIYHWGAFELAVDSAHRFGWKRTTDAGLAELAAYDGTTLVRRYPELGLDVVGPLDGAIAQLAYAPMLVADAGSLARYFDARADRGNVVLSRGGRVAGTIEFDAAHHPTAIVDANGNAVVRIAWTGNAPSRADVRGERVSIGFTAEPIADATAWAAAAPGVTIALPLRQPQHWLGVLAQLTAGDAAYRDAQHQLMASYLASNNLAAAKAVMTPASLGEKVLAGDAPSSPLVDDLRNLRTLLERAQNGNARGAAELLAKLQSTQLRTIGASVLTSAYDAPAELVAKAWDSLAVGRAHNSARAQAALLLQNRGDTEGAAARVVALATDYDVAADPANLQWAMYSVQNSRRGLAGWAIAYGAMRDRIMASGDLEHLLALAPLALQQQQGPVVLMRAGELAANDPDRLAVVAQLAASYGQPGLATQLIAPALAAHPSRTLAQLAAGLELQAGRLADALGHLEQAQALGADEQLGLAAMRGELAQLIGVAQQLAMSSTGAARDAAVARAARWGAKWRAVDPGNSQTDETLGRLYLALGNTQEAWRQLSGVIERDPWNGQGYATVAQTYEQQGKVADALAFWQQAIVIDQTNPTHRLRKAQALIALGRTGEGEAILHDITGRKWHDAWSGVVYQAQDLLARGHR